MQDAKPPPNLYRIRLGPDLYLGFGSTIVSVNLAAYMANEAYAREWARLRNGVVEAVTMSKVRS